MGDQGGKARPASWLTWGLKPHRPKARKEESERVKRGLDVLIVL